MTFRENVRGGQRNQDMTSLGRSLEVTNIHFPIMELGKWT